MFGKRDDGRGKNAFRAGNTLAHCEHAVYMTQSSGITDVGAFSGTTVMEASTNGRVLVVACNEHMYDVNAMTGIQTGFPLVIRYASRFSSHF